MPTKLNDTQLLEIVTKYANGTSISALAKDYEVSRPTITKYIEKNAELLQKITDKKEESIAQWLETHKSDLTGILDQITQLLPNKLKEASARELFGGLKILTDLGINLKTDKPQGDDKQDEITIEFVDNSGGDSEE